MRRLAFALLFFAIPATAQAPDLAPLKALLLPLRTTHGSNEQRDAGPELTPVKDALRRWVEARLPPAERPGPDGAVISLSPDDLTDAARGMNAALDAAGLTCGREGDPAYRCTATPAQQETDRGYVGDIRLGLLGDGRYLTVVTGVGVRCGDDESAYIYQQRPDHGWRLLLASEQDRYGEQEYSPQNFLAIDVSPSTVAWNEPAPPPLVATLGYSPWCSSNWNALATRLWRTTPASATPTPLLDRIDGLYLGGEPVAAERLTATDLLVELTAGSADTDVFTRRRVLRFAIGADDRLTRTDPVALDPAGFVEEWLTEPWRQARRWLMPGTDPRPIVRFHRPAPADGLLGTFAGPPTRCRADPALWQVSFAEEPGGGAAGPPRFFKVRWDAPYRFRLVAVGRRPFAGCGLTAANPDPVGTLFPEQGKAP